MYDDTDIPVFLNRKLNAVEPATMDERRAYCPHQPVQEVRVFSSINEDEIREERKERARERIAKMKARMEAKKACSAQSRIARSIPKEHLGWDAQNLRFYDMRVRSARKLAAARKRLGLDGGSE